jgi:Holliday junction resolvase RusA-like endonuclease
MTVLPQRRTLTVPEPTETPWTLDVLGKPEIAFAVYGKPSPQGSKHARPIFAKTGCRMCRFTGKVAVVESAKDGVKAWRHAVAQVAGRETLGGIQKGWILLEGPIVMDMVFTMPKGTSLAKWLDWHDRMPDLSKLARSTEDALTKILYKDDGQITGYRRLEARFEGSDDPDALDKPGAVIRAWRVPDALIDARRAGARRRS